MAHELTLELSSAAYRRLLRIQNRFREPTPEDAIYRALGVLELLGDYIDPSTGVLTVVNPQDEDDKTLEIEFELLVPEPERTSA